MVSIAKRPARIGISLVTVGLAMAAAAGSSPRSAEAGITRAEAERAAVRALGARSERGPTRVFGLPSPLSRGDRVYEAGGPGTRRVRSLKRAAWFFWQDLAPGAGFAHPSVLLLIDARSGKVVRRQKLQWFPFINGKQAPFLKSAAAYNSRRFVVYPTRPRSGRAVAPRHVRGGVLARAYAAAKNRQDALKHDCMVTIGDFGAPNFAGDKKAMDRFADAVGLTKANVERPTFERLRETVSAAVTDGCRDVFLFIAGHGRPPPEYWSMGKREKAGADAGPPGVIVNPDFKLSEDEVKNKSAYITPENLIDLANEFAPLGVDFKIKIHSCFSGRFEEVFRKARNVAVLETSSAADEVSYTFATAPGDKYLVADPLTHKATREAKADDTDNPDGAGSFVNANVHGLMEWAATAPPDSTLLTGILNSLTLGDGFDFAENINYTHPLKLNRTPFDNIPLTISPIGAEFVDADRATYYTVPVVNDYPGAIIFYDWTLSLEAVDPTVGVDNGCVNARGGGFTWGESRFMWAHGNTGDPVHDDGCDHMLVGQYGHQGLITVVVRDLRGASCTATYKGTNTSDANSVANGVASEPACTLPPPR